MKVSTNHILQGLLLIGQLGNFLVTVTPEKYRFLTTGALSVLQWLVSNKAHWSEPTTGQKIADPTAAAVETKAEIAREEFDKAESSFSDFLNK